MKKEKQEFLKELLNDKSKIKILNDRLSIMLYDKDFYTFGLLEEVVDTLIENGYEKTISNNFHLIIKTSIEDETLYIINKVVKISNGKELLKDNLKLIFSKLDGEAILKLLELLDEKEKKRIKDRNACAYKLYNEDLIGGNILGCIIKSDMSMFIEEVIKEVSNGKELKKLNSGTFNDVIETNGFVIKIGETREKFEIPYHPNILQPLLRERVQDERGNTILVVEVQNLVNTKDVTEKDRKALKKKLEEAKIKCADLYGDNVGILIKPNIRYLHDGVGGIVDVGDIEEKTEMPGSPVLLDTDMIEKEK